MTISSISNFTALRHYFLPAVAALLLLHSCKMNDNKQAPVSREKMQEILTDINIAEVYSTMVLDSTHKGGTKNEDSLAAYYHYIFEHHHITKEEFEKGMIWYKAHPDEMDSVINGMMPVVEKWLPGSK